ncbi:MAG: MraY family glycosyltransferase [Candidatus Melainabacteria bacterium]|nr:MraY family glycosyltransferase [Candidatus Melainabacteria bacterium]
MLGGFGFALVLSLLMVPLVRQKAVLVGMFDNPGERKIHQNPVPRLGGVAIFASFMVAFWLLLITSWDWAFLKTNGILGLFAGGSLIFLLGLLDDLFNISAYVKLLAQVLAAVVAYYLGVQITLLDLPSSNVIVLHAFSLPVTVLWLVGLSNALNFIDGVDGLAGGVTTFSALTLILAALFTHQDQAALLAALLAGASFGFLVFNIHPARIFMGDSGALFAGFTLAAISVIGVLKEPVAVMLLPVLVLSVPVMDITYSTLRRLFRGKNPFVADADHLHHRLLKAGLSQNLTVWTFYLVCVLSGLWACLYIQRLPEYLLMISAFFLLMFVLMLILRQDALRVIFQGLMSKKGSAQPEQPPAEQAHPPETPDKTLPPTAC